MRAAQGSGRRAREGGHALIVPRFELDRWVHHYQDSNVPHDLSGSTGPVWTFAEVLELGGRGVDWLADIPASYSKVEGEAELRHAVATAEGVRPDDVQITTGASEALTILTAALAQPGGNVVAPDPGYAPFGALATIFGMETRRYPLTPENHFLPRVEDFGRLVDNGTVMVILNSPHNPTGACLGREEIEAGRSAAERVGAAVVVDQVFHPISHGAPPLEPLASKGMIVVGDLSKALSLPGPRIGWIVDTDATRRDSYFDLRAFFTLTSSPLSERVAIIALQNRTKVLDRCQRIAEVNLASLSRFVEGLGDRLGWVRPTGGLTAFPWLRGIAESRTWCKETANRGVLLAPGDCFGRPAHFRIGFGASEPSAFDAALEVLGSALPEA